MRVLHRGILLILLIVTVTGCGADRPPDAYDIDVVGCGVAQVHQSSDTNSAALDATINACPGAVDPVGRVARAVWLSRSGDVDSIRIRAAGPASVPTDLSRDELMLAYGEMGLSHQSSTSYLWPLMLLLPLAAAGAAVLVTRGLRTGAVLLIASR